MVSRTGARADRDLGHRMVAARQQAVEKKFRALRRALNPVVEFPGLCMTARLGSVGEGGMSSLRYILVDLFLIAVATVAAPLIRDNFQIVAPRLIAFVPYLIITLGVAGLVFPVLGISRSLWRFTSLRDGLRIVAATIIVVLSATAIGFAVNRLDGVARAVPLIQGLLIISLLVGARALTRVSHDRRIRSASAPHGEGVETVLLIGLNKLAELYLQCLAELDTARVSIAGVLGEASRVGLFFHSHPVLGTPEGVLSTLRRLELHGVFVDRIIVTTLPDRLSPSVQYALSQVQTTTTIRIEYLAERMGVQSPPVGSAIAKPASKEAAGSAVAAIDLAFDQVPYHRVKRALDLLGSALLVVILAPVFLLVGLLVAVDVGLPLVFWQQRPGLRGRPFKLYKFRTMADAYAYDGQRKSDNERISAVGNVLRESRLDELPQLLNILKGEMSFVGPRPLLPVDQPIDSKSRLLVRPGLTGWAQIKGGRQISPDDKAALDLWYVRNMSLALDLKILLGTLPVLIFGGRVTETAIVDAWRAMRITMAQTH
jgi:lipopolysaccharide/colanic/teichoic acid biosynthesis glycosyltransferase